MFKSLPPGYFNAFLSSAEFFSKLTFSKKIINTFIVSNSLDLDQAGRLVGPGLGPNCLRMLLADDTGRHSVHVSDAV